MTSQELPLSIKKFNLASYKKKTDNIKLNSHAIHLVCLILIEVCNYYSAWSLQCEKAQLHLCMLILLDMIISNDRYLLNKNKINSLYYSKKLFRWCSWFVQLPNGKIWNEYIKTSYLEKDPVIGCHKPNTSSSGNFGSHGFQIRQVYY